MGDTVYIHDLSSNIRAFDRANGDLRWERRYDQSQIGPSGVAVGWGKVFATKGSREIVALDSGTGKELWSTVLPQTETAGISIQPQVYDDLVKCELTSYLRDSPGTFDVIVSADTLVYFGPLDDVVVAAARALRGGGHFIFTVEALSDDQSQTGYVIAHHGRYCHTRQYVERLQRGAGLQPEIQPAELRIELVSLPRGYRLDRACHHAQRR